MTDFSSAIEAPSAPPVDADRVRRRDSRFTGRGGVSLFRASWTPPEPRRIVLIVHGFGEHCLRYDHFAEWLARRECAVHGFDLRGHGRSQGRRGHIGKFSEYLDDVEAFLELVRGELPDLPITLVGHSLGGLIVCAFIRERNPRLTSVVTSGAALAPSQEVAGFRLMLARMLRSVAPKFAMEVGIDPQLLSNDREVCRLYTEDPYVHGRMSTSHAVEMFETVAKTRGGGGAVRLPMLLLHGGDDRLCRSAGSEAFHASLLGAVMADSGRGDAPKAELKVYPGLRHEIFNEPEREEIYGDLLDWVSRIEAFDTKPHETRPLPERASGTVAR